MIQYPKEFIKPLLLSFDTMERCNIQIGNRGSLWKKLRFIYIIPFSFIFYISLGLSTVRMFSRDVPAIELAFMISTLLIIIQATFKAVIVLPKITKIAELIEKLGLYWRTDNLNERQICKKEFILKRLNFCLKVFYWGSVIPAWNILLAPALVVLWKMLFKQEAEFLLPFGFVLPFDPFENWMRYVMVYAFQVYSVFRFVYIYIGTEILMVTLCALLSAEFGILRDDFEYFQPDLESNNITIQDLIRKHQQLLLYSNHLNDIFNKMLFFDLLFITVIMCLYAFSATVARSTLDVVNNFFAFLALLLPAFIFCYYSEQLKEESGGIADAAYNNMWYRGSASYQRSICFVIKRAQKPSSLMSLRYMPVTLNTFSKVVSSTWSYFSIVRSMYNDK